MQSKRIKIYSYAAALALAIPQYGQMSNPLLGLAQSDDGAQIQPVMGVLGSAGLAPAIALPSSVVKSHLAPGQGWALADDASGGLGLLKFSEGSLSAYQLIGNAAGGADLVAFSPRGTSAALATSKTGLLQVLKGLDKSATVLALTLPKTGASLVSLAVTDAADLVVGLFDDGGVYLLYPGAAAQFVTRLGLPSGIAFLPDQSALIVADGAAGLVSVLDGVGASLQTRASVSVGPLSGTPVLVSSTLDGRTLLLAGLGSSSMVRVSLSDLTVSSISVPSVVSRIDRFGGGNEFLFSGASSDTALWILAAGGPELQTAFAQPHGISKVSPRLRPEIVVVGRN